MKKQKKGLIFIFIVALYSSIFASISTNSEKAPIVKHKPLDIRTAATKGYESEIYITWGGANYDSGTDIILDGSGNIYITGYTCSFGAGDRDAFIAKYDSSGNLLWDEIWGNNDFDSGHGIALDGSGNVYITGDNSTAYGDSNVFIAKYDTLGNFLKNITWGGSHLDYCYDIVLDVSENIYITGGTRSFGAGGEDAFIAKYDSSENLLWNETWGGSNDDTGLGIALDGAGNIYITGRTYSFGGGYCDAFIAKYDGSGNYLMNMTWGGTNNDEGKSIVVDGLGNIYITGDAEKVGLGHSYAFILKYDSSGDLLWDYKDENLFDGGQGIALHGSDIYITTRIANIGAGRDDVFVGKYDSSGNYVRGITWGGTDTDVGKSIVVDGLGNVFITGRTENFGAVNFNAIIVKNPSNIIYPSNDDTQESNPNLDLILLIGLLIIISVSAMISLTLFLKKRSQSILWYKMKKKQRKKTKSPVKKPYYYKNAAIMNNRYRLHEGQPFFPQISLNIGVYCGSCETQHSISRKQFDRFICSKCGNKSFNIGYFCRKCNWIYPLSVKEFIELKEPENLNCSKCDSMRELLKL